MRAVTANRVRSLVRTTLIVVLAATLYAALTVYEREQFATKVETLTQNRLTNYFSSAFPPDLLPNSGEIQPDTDGIKRRMRAFNAAHAEHVDRTSNLRLEVVRVGPVDLPSELSPPKTEIALTLQGRAGDPQIRLNVPPPAWLDIDRLFPIAGFALLGLLTTAVFPHPTPINAYPVARDMALIFDRKVSANRRWGTYQLTHLGGGGPLPEIADNNPQACNDTDQRLTCFDAITATYDAVKPRLWRAIPGVSVRSGFIEAMDTGFANARKVLTHSTPSIHTDTDVTERFRPFVRDEVLGFALIALEHESILAGLSDLPEDRIRVDAPPTWLIGGYEVYFPRLLLQYLIDEIDAGLKNAYTTSFDSIHVFATSASPFITIDFITTDQVIDTNNRKRLDQYLAQPFSGGLNRIDSLVAGSGHFMLIDTESAYDISNRQKSSERASSGLINRIMFRTVHPQELALVRKQINL